MRQFKLSMKGLIFTLIAALLLSACSGGNTGNQDPNTANSPAATGSSSGGQATDENEPITLTVFCTDCMEGGIQKTKIAEEIQKKFNITLDVIKGDEQKLQALVAGGDLPDIVTLEGAVVSMKDTLIQSGQVIPLDDLLDQYGQNIKKYSSFSLDAMRAVNSNNTGKVYYLTTAQEKSYEGLVKKNASYGFFTRWDLYKKIGAPEMKNEDDYLQVLKQIQDQNPTASNGKKAYALSAWTDWGIWPYTITYPFSYGYLNLGSLLLHRETGEVEATFTNPDGVFWRGIKFYNKAYQMGLFDPDGFIQKSTQNSDRRKTGEILTHAMPSASGTMIENAGGDTNAQLIMIPGAFPYIPGVYTEDNPWGWGMLAHAITSNNKYPERTMQLFDYMNSPEGARLLFSGIQGVDWDYVDGKPELIGEMSKTDNEDYRQLVGVGQYSKVLSGFAGSYPDENGFPVDLGVLVKPELITDAEKDFAAHYGNFEHPGQVYDQLIKDGKAKSATQFWPAQALIESPSDTSAQTLNRATEYFMANVAKYIMAKDDTAFEAEKKKAIEEFNNMGVTEAFDEVINNYEDAKRTAASFGQ